MDIEIIREFVEFSKTLNFSKTARAVNISQSAFSSHILKLEKDLDAKLIDRGQSNVLTGEGKLFLEYATSIVGSYDDVKSKLEQLHSGSQNVVRVHKAIFSAKSCDYFNRELYAFGKAHPDIVVRHVADDLNPTTRMLKDGCIDFGFIAIDCFDVVEGREEFDYEYFPFAREELVVWAPTNGLFANIESVHLQQLNGCVAVIQDGPLVDDQAAACKQLAKHYNIDLKLVTKSCFSNEEFYLSEFKANEIVLGIKSRFESNSACSFRHDMTVHSFTEPVTGTAYVGYRPNDENPALLELIAWMKEHTYLD